MLSHFYVHTPIQSPYEWLLAKYGNKIPPDTPNREKRVEYAAFVETLYHYIGQGLDALRDSGLEKDTLVVFFSDNGGHPEYVSNKPFRGSKWNLYEGGIRVPMIVRWPGSVETGTVCSEPVIGYDLLPTFLDVAGQPLEPETDDLDGQSILPVLLESTGLGPRPLVWHFPYYHPENNKFGAARKTIGVDDFEISQTRPQSAMRMGSYKLVYFEETKQSELYDLGTDASEQHDLSTRDPDTKETMVNALLRYLDSVNARRALPR